MNAASENKPLFQIVSHLCALVVAVYFLYAAWGKLGPAEVRQFSVEISNYKILPAAYTNIPAVILPFVEIFGALALIHPATRKAGSILIGGMLLFFIGAVFYAAIIKGLKISCGCTGAGSGTAGWLTIGRNLLLVAGVVLSNKLYRPADNRNAAARFEVDPPLPAAAD